MIIVDKVVVRPTEAGNGVTYPRINTPDKPVPVPIKPPIVESIRAKQKLNKNI